MLPHSNAVIAVNLIKVYKPGESAAFPIIGAERITGGETLVFEGPFTHDFACKMASVGSKAGLRLVYATDKSGQRLQENSPDPDSKNVSRIPPFGRALAQTGG